MRVPVGRVPRIKQIILKNACDNVDFRRTNEINPKLTGAKDNKVKKN
jgi:hypothetical protein